MNKKITTNEYSEYKQELIVYYWKCFISEFSKICLFFVIFMFLENLSGYIIALLTLITLRSNGGGLHFKHYTSCLIVSFSFLYGSIFLSKYVTPSQYITYITAIVCIFLGYKLVPITSSNRPPVTPKQAKRSKRNTSIVILLLFMLICLCPNIPNIFVCYWTIILHILQLIIANVIKEVKKNV